MLSINYQSEWKSWAKAKDKLGLHNHRAKASVSVIFVKFYIII